MAYEIALPPHLENLHNVFHVSQLRKYIADPTHMLEEDYVQVREDLMIRVGPVRILDSQVKRLRSGCSSPKSSQIHFQCLTGVHHRQVVQPKNPTSGLQPCIAWRHIPGRNSKP